MRRSGCACAHDTGDFLIPYLDETHELLAYITVPVMALGDNRPARLSLDLAAQNRFKSAGDQNVHEYRTNNQGGLSRSPSLASLNATDSEAPISPLSVSPSPSTRADDSMSEISLLSPCTPFLALSPPSVTPQKTPFRELDSPTSLSPCVSTRSLDPFVQSPESRGGALAPTSKANFRTKAKGLTFKIPSLPTPRSGQIIGRLDAIRQGCDVSPLPSPLARDLQRRVEANDQDTQMEMDITSYGDDNSGPIPSLLHRGDAGSTQATNFKSSSLGLDLGLPTPQTEESSSDLSSYVLGAAIAREESEPSGNHREAEHAGAKIMQASLARSASAELVPSFNRSQARQTNMVSSLSAHENLSTLPSKKYARKSIPLPTPHLQSPFASVSIAEQDRSAYTLDLRSLPPSPEEAMSKRDGRMNNPRLSPSIGRFLSRSPLSPSPKRKPTQRAAYDQLSAADLSQLQMQGCARFPKYFPEGYLLEPKFARQYCLETELGAGGYGFVLSARNMYTDEQVAVKFIDRRSVPIRGLIRDHKNDIMPLEAVVLQLAEHPGVVRFYGLYEDGLFFYLVQELHGSPWSKNAKNKHKSDQESVDANGQQDDGQPPRTLSDATRSKPSSPYAPFHSSPLRPLVASSSLPSIPTLGRIASSFREDASALFSPRGSAPLLTVRPQMPRRASYDLFECIEQHERLSEGQAKYIFAQVVETVWYLDSIGITHRDIKDENLVIDREFKVKFIDFGSAVIRDVRKPPPTYTSFFGTVTFASPEILKNLPYTAPPAEVWTLGILLSFLVAGQSPFPTTEHAMHALMCEPHESIVVSPACGDLMRKCLNPDPVRRHTIQQVREHPWLRGALDRA